MTAFELYIWGPGFDLPSIDAECLAAVAYLNHAIPASEWTLVPSSDPSVTSSNRLPALHAKTSDEWTAGYDAIVTYLSSQTPYNLNAGLSPAQVADTAAYSAYISQRLGPLLDVSLFALPSNWTETTRPAYSAILPFPLTWTVPTAMRTAALDRAGHLISGLSLSGEEEEDEKDLGPLDAAMKHIPTTRRKGIFDAMAPGQAATIRLHAMAIDALSVLEDLRSQGEEVHGTKTRLLPGLTQHEQVTSLDCLAFGYLSLMRDAPVTHNFLQKVLASKYQALVLMLDDLKSTCLTAPGPLPWADDRALTTSSKSTLHTLSRFIDDVIRVTPRLGEHYSNEIRRRAELGSTSIFDRRNVTVASSMVVAGTALAYGIWWYRTLAPFGLRTQTWTADKGSRLGNFGAIGAMLDFSFGAPSTNWSAGSSAPSAGPGVSLGFEDGQNKIVEADVTVE